MSEIKEKKEKKKVFPGYMYFWCTHVAISVKCR